MAWGASSGTVANQNAKSASATYTAGAITCPIGNQIFLLITFDNIAAATPVVNSITRAASETAAWVKLASGDSASSTAEAGLRTELWAITPAVTWTAFTPVVTLSASVTAKASCGFCKTGGTLNLRETVPYALTAASSATPTLTTAATGLGAPVNGDLVIGIASRQQPQGTFGADSDSTNGSWSAAIDSGTTGGTSNTNVNAYLQHKTVTADGAQTFNLTSGLSTGHHGVFALAPASSPTTEQASRVHAEAMVAPTPDEQVSRVHAEAMVAPTPDEQVSRIHLEVMISNTPNPYWSWIA